MTVEDAAETIYAGLLAKPDGGAAVIALELEASVNRNGGTICLLTRWGAHLNPKSYWHRVGMDVLGEPTTLFIAVDNNANAGK